ncbi:MAG TPA: ATP-binding protein [Patescibacteria group bacterium]|nr:ATP-binding protein [Patescibacteria group bacterium]
MSLTEEQKIKRIFSLKGIIMSRWFLILGLALVGVVQRIAGVGVTSLTPTRLIVLASLPIIYNALFALYIRRPPQQINERSIRILSLLQVFIDQAMITAIVYYTGGVESINFIVYFFPLLAATILFTDIEVIILSLVNILMYIALVVMEYVEIISHHSRYLHNPNIFQNFEATLLNVTTIALMMLLLALLAAFVNRILHEREVEILVERDKVRSILNSLEDGIIMLDTQNRILSINPPALTILRLYKDQEHLVLDKNHFPKPFHQLITAILDQPSSKRLGQEVLIPEGEDNSYIQVDSIPMYGTDGKIISWVKVVKDITRERELDEVKSDFISVAAHQLRTPLAGLKWFFQLMIDGDAGKISEEQKKLLIEADEQNKRVIDIINNLLDVSDVEGEHSQYEFKNEDFSAVVEEIIRTSKRDTEQKHIQLDFQKSCPKMPHIMIDKIKLRMALQNLVDNAIKYSSEGSTIFMRTWVKHGRLLFSIQDQGMGIPKKEQSKIFSKFFRASNAKAKVSTGSGLGLYIVKKMIQKHRGQVWFESKLGQGTTFFVSLPIPRKYLQQLK